MFATVQVPGFAARIVRDSFAVAEMLICALNDGAWVSTGPDSWVHSELGVTLEVTR